MIGRLELIGDNVLYPSDRPSGDGELAWIARALTEHRREPFAGIVARESRGGEPQVLEAGNLDDADTRFSGIHNFMVRRNAADIAACVSFLLRDARTVKLIDPYINPSRSDYRRPIEHMFAAVRRPDAIVEIHTSDHFETGWLVQQLDRWLGEEGSCPAAVAVKAYQHPLSEMHNRYVLTDYGGVMFGVGLNDAEDGEGVPEDDVTLMTEEVRRRRWEEFQSEGEIAMWRDEGG